MSDKKVTGKNAQENQASAEYVIKFIPPGSGDVKSIHLTPRVLKYGVVSLIAIAVLFVSTFAYSVYSTFIARGSIQEVQDLREVNSIQQEQLLQLAKKANTMQEQLDQLKQLENELRQLSGLAPSEDSKDNQQPAAESQPTNEAASHNGQGGPAVQPNMQHVGDALDTLEKQVETRRESMLALKQHLTEQKEKYGAIISLGMPGGTTPSIWPTRGEVSSPYGLRWNGSEFHPGMDIANDMGTPILATADGVVSFAGWNDGGYGNMVDIEHGNGIMTRYAHAMQVTVASGQTVRRGQVIAYMGSTGRSTGPHVHYEVRVNGNTVNPVSYLH